MPSKETIWEIAKVNIEKLMIRPETTPSGRRLPPVNVDESTIGRTGRIHGDSTVTRPDRSEKRIKIIIVSTLYEIYVTKL
jgi:hypothetical protein